MKQIAYLHPIFFKISQFILIDRVRLAVTRVKALSAAAGLAADRAVEKNMAGGMRQYATRFC
mgnify:CR=1 FL=1